MSKTILDHQHRLSPRSRDIPLPRHLWREQVCRGSADRQSPVRSLATRRRGRGGAVERLPDQLFASIQTPAGTEVTKSYGEVGQIPDAMFKSFMSRFASKDAPNPHDVAEAVAKLVGQSKGSRATRTVVGEAFGSDKANEDVASVQAKAVEALGLSNHEKIAS